jgi:hypothetical protein
MSGAVAPVTTPFWHINDKKKKRTKGLYVDGSK